MQSIRFQPRTQSIPNQQPHQTATSASFMQKAPEDSGGKDAELSEGNTAKDSWSQFEQIHSWVGI